MVQANSMGGIQHTPRFVRPAPAAALTPVVPAPASVSASATKKVVSLRPKVPAKPRKKLVMKVQVKSPFLKKRLGL